MAHAFAAAIHPTQTQKNKEKELRKKSGAPKSDLYSIDIKLQNIN
jgi:hypothetical protein